jgi:lipid-A-disaccharide synthase
MSKPLSPETRPSSVPLSEKSIDLRSMENDADKKLMESFFAYRQVSRPKVEKPAIHLKKMSLATGSQVGGADSLEGLPAPGLRLPPSLFPEEGAVEPWVCDEKEPSYTAGGSDKIEASRASASEEREVRGEHRRQDQPQGDAPKNTPLKLFFCAGEPSGDLHAAALIRKLHAGNDQLEVCGYGGPEMQKAGCRLHFDLTEMAVMWLGRALWNLRKFKRLVDRAEEFFRNERPDAVVLVDYPGFNWHIAQRAKKHGVPVYYFMPPQIWAWAQWRVKKMGRLIDHVLCCLPFEERWFKEHGCHVHRIGHPFFEEARQKQLDPLFLDQMEQEDGPLLLLLPGSRDQEVSGNIQDLLQVAGKVLRNCPQARIAVGAFKTSQAERIREIVSRRRLPIEVHVGKTSELIRLADGCVAVSGSVSLELLAHGTPTVIYYKISRVGYLVQHILRKVRYITLVNLLATDRVFREEGPAYDPADDTEGEALFPEFLTYRDRTGEVADRIIAWFQSPPLRRHLCDRLARLVEEVDDGVSATEQAADYIVQTAVTRKTSGIPAPHVQGFGKASTSDPHAGKSVADSSSPI